MANTHRYSTQGALVTRIALLDANGSPDDGSGGTATGSHGYTTDSAISIGWSPEISAGADVEQKNAAGGICASYKEADKIKRVNITWEMCQFDLPLLALITGASLITFANGDAAGLELPKSTSTLTRRVSIEWWTRGLDGSAAALPAGLSGSAMYYHHVIPSAQFTFGDLTFDDTIDTIPVTGQGFENTRITTNGPFDDWPTYVRNFGGITSAYGVFMDSLLPTVPEDGYTNVTSLAS